MRRARGRRALLAAAAAALLVPAPGRAESPEVLYMLHCQGCHLEDGMGRPGAVRAFPGTLGRLLAAPGARAYLVQVPGSAQAPIADAELAGLLTWLVARFAPEAGAAFAPYSAAEVARYRATPLADPAAARAALLGSEEGPRRAGILPATVRGEGR